MQRVCVIGPVPPWRGGISDHTAYLSSALGEFANVHVYSFSRQYPKFLYPGQAQKAGIRDIPNVQEVRFIIDSLNPITWLKCLILVREVRADTVVIPWWSNFWLPQTLFFLLSLKQFHVRSILICHNSLPHEGSLASRLLASVIFKAPDFVVAHSVTEKSKILELGRRRKVLVNFHPPYDHFPKVRYPLKRRASIELLFFGFIRDYKGVDILLDALGDLPRNFAITIAGECWCDKDLLLNQVRRLRLEDNVEFIFEFVSDERASALFSRADIVCLPYRSSTGSGIIPTAYKFGKPVIASTAGSNEEMVLNGKSGWLFEPENTNDLERILRSIIENGIPDMSVGIEEMLKRLSWSTYAASLLAPEP